MGHTRAVSRLFDALCCVVRVVCVVVGSQGTRVVGGGPEREEEDASSLREVVCNAEDGLDGFFFLFVDVDDRSSPIPPQTPALP
jgi:hypothetical protein